MNEAQRRAKHKYRAKVKRVYVDFYPTEQDLIDHLATQEKLQTYIKALIRADMEKSQ